MHKFTETVDGLCAKSSVFRSIGTFLQLYYKFGDDDDDDDDDDDV